MPLYRRGEEGDEKWDEGNLAGEWSARDDLTLDHPPSPKVCFVQERYIKLALKKEKKAIGVPRMTPDLA
jgi:hypothetical protein